jgi:hypothetical protein
VLVAAAFWTLLWGPGRAAPVDAADHVPRRAGAHVKHLQFFEVLLDDQPNWRPRRASTSASRADDADEAAHQAEAFLKGRPLSVYYDEVAIMGLALAQLDVNRGALDRAQRIRIKEAID